MLTLTSLCADFAFAERVEGCVKGWRRVFHQVQICERCKNCLRTFQDLEQVLTTYAGLHVCRAAQTTVAPQVPLQYKLPNCMRCDDVHVSMATQPHHSALVHCPQRLLAALSH